MKENQFRPIIEKEKQVLLKMLDIDFTGRDILRQQLEGLLVKIMDDDGSLSFQVESNSVAPITTAVAVEARCPDLDSKEMNDPHINLLLHVVDGKMKQLEIYRDDSKPILREPDPGNLHLFSALADRSQK